MATAKAFSELAQSDRWFRYWMPYTFHKLDHPRLKHVYLPLNRNYKPLGITSREGVRYEDFIGQAIAFAQDPSGFKDVWDDTTPKGLFLYADSPNTRTDYFERLGRLLSKPSRLVSIADEERG